jgi:hypothetical protein
MKQLRLYRVRYEIITPSTANPGITLGTANRTKCEAVTFASDPGEAIALVKNTETWSSERKFVASGAEPLSQVWRYRVDGKWFM